MHPKVAYNVIFCHSIQTCQIGEIEMDNLPYFKKNQAVSWLFSFLGLLTSILTYFDPQIVHQSQNTTESCVQCYILSWYTYLCQIGEMEMDKLTYLISRFLKDFRYFGTFYVNFDLFRLKYSSKGPEYP